MNSSNFIRLVEIRKKKYLRYRDHSYLGTLLTITKQLQSQKHRTKYHEAKSGGQDLKVFIPIPW